MVLLKSSQETPCLRLNLLNRTILQLLASIRSLVSIGLPGFALAQTGPGSVGDSTTVFGWWDADNRRTLMEGVVPTFQLDQLGSNHLLNPQT